jgi:hypothetical protein
LSGRIFSPVSPKRELMKKVCGIWSHIILRQILFEGADAEVGGIWSNIIFRPILFEGADAEFARRREGEKAIKIYLTYECQPNQDGGGQRSLQWPNGKRHGEWQWQNYICRWK